MESYGSIVLAREDFIVVFQCLAAPGTREGFSYNVLPFLVSENHL